MADVKKINGYNVKDATARQQIANLPISKIQHGRIPITLNSGTDPYLNVSIVFNTPTNSTNYTILTTVEWRGSIITSQNPKTSTKTKKWCRCCCGY